MLLSPARVQCQEPAVCGNPATPIYPTRIARGLAPDPAPSFPCSALALRILEAHELRADAAMVRFGLLHA